MARPSWIYSLEDKFSLDELVQHSYFDRQRNEIYWNFIILIYTSICLSKYNSLENLILDGTGKQQNFVIIIYSKQRKNGLVADDDDQ
jgi:NAD-dependent SIR2 family protein deacetylase